MGYTVEKITMSDAKERLNEYRYALLYKIEGVELYELTGKFDADVLLDGCYEARFFNEAGELHVFEQDGNMMGILVNDTGEDSDYLLTEYVLAKKYQNIAHFLLVKRYLTPDKDGQMNVSLTRLAGIGR